MTELFENFFYGDAPVRRTKQSHPYSYDPFTVWKGPVKPNNSVYTDRLRQWDFAKHDEICLKHFGNKGQYWGNRDPRKVEDFLRDFLNDPGLTLCEIVEYCNQSNGYPVWCLRYLTSSGL